MAYSISDAITQNTVGQSEGYPDSVPTSYSWYSGAVDGSDEPPANFTAVTGWGQVYNETGATADPDASVQVANAQTWIHLKSTDEWVLVQNQSTDQLEGGQFVGDFSGNAASSLTSSVQADGSIVFDAPSNGYNDHFWPAARGTYDAGDVDGVYVQMDMKTDDPDAQLVANVGADWWLDASAGYVDGFSNNPGAGMSNWVELSTDWKTVSFYTMSAEELEADPPPPLATSDTSIDTTLTTVPDSGNASADQTSTPASDGATTDTSGSSTDQTGTSASATSTEQTSTSASAGATTDTSGSSGTSTNINETGTGSDSAIDTSMQTNRWLPRDHLSDGGSHGTQNIASDGDSGRGRHIASTASGGSDGSITSSAAGGSDESAASNVAQLSNSDSSFNLSSMFGHGSVFDDGRNSTLAFNGSGDKGANSIPASDAYASTIGLFSQYMASAFATSSHGFADGLAEIHSTESSVSTLTTPIQHS